MSINENDVPVRHAKAGEIKQRGRRVNFLYEELQQAILGIPINGEYYLLTGTEELGPRKLAKTHAALDKWRRRRGEGPKDWEMHHGRAGGLYIRKPVPGQEVING